MDNKAYEKLEEIQDRHWWFLARKEIILDIFLHYCAQNGGKADKTLDVGCGMGAMLDALEDAGCEVYGMDFSKIAVDYCRRKRGNVHIRYGKLPDEVPFPDNYFDSILALDLLEHIENDEAALASLYKILKPDGKLLITVPAFQTLWGYNDIVVHHYRRYTMKELLGLCKNCSLEIDLYSYYNFWLFLPVWLVRKAKKLLKVKKDDMMVTNRPINTLFYHIFVSEKKWLRKHRFPFGVSIILVAKKRGNTFGNI